MSELLVLLLRAETVGGLPKAYCARDGAWKSSFGKCCEDSEVAVFTDPEGIARHQSAGNLPDKLKLVTWHASDFVSFQCPSGWSGRPFHHNDGDPAWKYISMVRDLCRREEAVHLNELCQQLRSILRDASGQSWTEVVSFLKECEVEWLRNTFNGDLQRAQLQACKAKVVELAERELNRDQINELETGFADLLSRLQSTKPPGEEWIVLVRDWFLDSVIEPMRKQQRIG